MPQADMIQPIQPPTRGAPGAPANADQDLQVLTFDIGAETLALEAALVQEIVDLLPATRVPGAPAIAAEIVNFRGRIIPLVDLRIAFGLPPAPPTVDSRIVVIAAAVGPETILCGLLADKVHEVRHVAESTMDVPPVVGMRWPRETIRRLVRNEGQIVILPDIDAILGAIIGRAAATPTPQSQH